MTPSLHNPMRQARWLALCALTALVAACGGDAQDNLSPPAPPVAADVAELGELALPADAAGSEPTSASQALLALGDLLPPDDAAAGTASFPADLLPPN
jgi:hypothetical protein